MRSSKVQLLLLLLFSAAIVSCQTIVAPLIRTHTTDHPLRKRQEHEQSNNVVPLFNFFGGLYLIELDVGTPPQKFNVTLDTAR